MMREPTASRDMPRLRPTTSFAGLRIKPFQNLLSCSIPRVLGLGGANFAASYCMMIQ